jgi:hypothetical protein
MKAMPAWFRLALSAPKVSVDAIVQYPSDPRKLQSINGFLVSISADFRYLNAMLSTAAMPAPTASPMQERIGHAGLSEDRAIIAKSPSKG